MARTIPVLRSLRTKLLLIGLVAALLPWVAATYAGRSAVRKMQDITIEFSRESHETLYEQMVARRARVDALAIAEPLVRMQYLAHQVADQCALILLGRIARVPSVGRPRLTLAPEGFWYDPDSNATASIFYSAKVPRTPGMDQSLARSPMLDPMLRSLLEHESAATAAFVASEDQWSRIVPWSDTRAAVRSGLLDPHIDKRHIVAYDLVRVGDSLVQFPVWSPPYEDHLGRGWMITCAAPIRHPDTGHLMGVLGVDVTLASISGALARVAPMPSGDAYLLMADGALVGTNEGLRRFGLTPGDRRPLVQLTGTPFEELVAAIRQLRPTVWKGRDGDYLVVGEPVRELSATYALMIPLAVMEAHSAAQADRLTRQGDREVVKWAGLALLASLLTVLMVAQFASRVTRPLAELEREALALSQGALSTRLTVHSQDELGRLAQAFNLMAGVMQQNIRELEGSNARMRAILAQAGIGIALYDTDRNIEWSNARFQNMTGEGAPFDESTLAKVLPDLVERAVRTGEVARRVVGHAGRALQVSATPVPRPGHPDAADCVVLLQDLTEIQALERKVRASEELANVGQLAASLAHEIRNPLNAIVIAAEQLARPEPPPQAALIAELLTSEARRLSATLTDFLSYARPVPPTLVPTDLADLVREVAVLGGAQYSPALGFVWSIDTQTPAPTLADPAQLKQVLWNLVLNAIQAMPSGGRIDLRTERVASASGDEAVVYVRDSGPGIPEEFRATLFHPFTSQRPGGTGLGLPIAHRIVTAHHGTLTFTTEVGVGTTFRIALPAV